MLVVFITKVKQKVLKGLRFTFVLAVLAILIVQLVGLIKNSGLYSRDLTPDGNPMKVQGPIVEVCEDEMNHGAFEKLLDYLLNNHRDKNK